MRKDRGEIQKAQKVQRRKLAVKEGKKPSLRMSEAGGDRKVSIE